MRGWWRSSRSLQCACATYLLLLRSTGDSRYLCCCVRRNLGAICCWDALHWHRGARLLLLWPCWDAACRGLPALRLLFMVND